MASGPKPVGELVAIGLIAGLIAFGLAMGTRGHGRPRPPARQASEVRSAAAAFELRPGAARVSVRSRDGALQRDLDLSLVVDGQIQPLVIGRGDVRTAAGVTRAAVSLPLGEAVAVDATLELLADPASDAVTIALRVAPDAELGEHVVGLRAELSSDGQAVFVAGVGQIADRALVSGGSVVVDEDPHPLGITSESGALSVEAMIEAAVPPGEPMRIAVISPRRTPPAADGKIADLRVAIGLTSLQLWQQLARLTGTATARVRGRVVGTAERTVLVGRDAQGTPQVRAHIPQGGAFDLEVPTTVVAWYAAVEPGRASSVVPFVPGTPHDVVLDVSPGGELHVTIVDADTRSPLTARLIVHGIDGTVDPSFGPDYRASGAGPILDSLRGDVRTPLPAGKYRVAATRGIEWTIDALTVDVTPGRTTDLVLAPRHVVPTPGVLGCDLHVHARPSFDSPVTPEDRVLSLVAAGIDFAVPTEHNIVGDYSSALESLDLRGEMLSVTGVEVTTTVKGFGHFGVFPYPPGVPVPPFKKTTMNAIFHAARAGDASRYFQLNHPRLPKGIGYFSNIGLDPKMPRSRLHNRVDFDGIEVYNGYDDEKPERIEQVLRDYWALLNFGWRFAATGSSDSHRIQFHWAGYPRTMVTVDPRAAASGVEGDARVDPLVVVANIKRGHATVTSGPILELELAGAHPGEEVVTTEDPLRGHLRVRAAPWIDITRVEIVVGGKVVQSIEVPSRPTQIGPEPGTLAEAAERTIRLDRDLEVAVGPDNGWVQIIARGERRMDDVLPFMPVPPFGFTNPVYVVRRRVPEPPWPTSSGPTPVRPQ